MGLGTPALWRRGVSRLAILVAVGFAGVAAAQDLTSTQTTILKKMTVTATRTAKAVLDVPQTVTVIDGETLDKRMVRDVQDLVRYEPGISVTRQTSGTNPFGQLSNFTIRGVSGNRVQILVDGGRIQELTIDGSRDFVDPFNLKAAELVRGPASVLWGSDALGGVVAFRTLDPSDLLDGSKPWAVEIKTAFDSFDGAFRKQVNAAYDFGDLQVLASVGHLNAHEPRLSTARADGGIWGCTRPAPIGCNILMPKDTNKTNALFKAVWTPNADHEVKATAEFYGEHSVVDQIYDSGATTGAPSTLAYNLLDYTRELDMTRYRASIEHNWQVNQPWLDSIKWQVSYSPQRRYTYSDQGRRYSNRDQRNEQIRDYGETFLEADLQFISSFDLGPTHHTLTYGFDGDLTDTNYEGVNHTWRSDTGTTVTATNQGFNFPKVKTRRADFYAQDEIALLDGRLTVTPGVRLSTYSIDPTGDLNYVPLPGFTPQVIDNVNVTKKLGAIYKLDDNFSVYASYGEGFKMPTSQQLFVSVNDIFTGNQVIPNPNLKPESVASYEAGIRGEFDRGFFSVGAFYSEYTNFIRSLAPVAGQPPTVVTSDNVEDVVLYGVEFTSEFEVLDNLFLNASATWSRGTQKVNAAAPTTPFDGAVPPTVVAGLRYELPEHNLQFEVVGTFAAGVTERSSPTAFKPDGYSLFDAYVKWEPNEHLQLTAGVQNIFDTRYFPNTLTGYDTVPASAAVANVNPLELQVGPGRTFKLGANLKF